MSGSRELSGVVLSREPTGDRFLRIRLFDENAGLQTVLFPNAPKNSKKMSPPDLFDDLECILKPRKSESSVPFVSDFQCLKSHREIAIDPQTFITASEIARFYLINGSHLLDPEPRLKLLRSSLSSFARASTPKVVLLKMYYCFARDEGLPVRESWLAGLSQSTCGDTLEILRMPVDQASPDSSKLNDILENLKIWLNAETELRVE